MSTKRKDRTSQGYRCSVLRRLKHIVRRGNRAEAHAFLSSDDFVCVLPRMTEYDRLVTLSSVNEIMSPLWVSMVPPTRSGGKRVRIEWDAATVGRLRDVAAKHGLRPGVDREIAREMRLPLHAVVLARYRFLGRIRAPQPNRRRRARGFPGRSQPGMDPGTTRAENRPVEYMNNSA